MANTQVVVADIIVIHQVHLDVIETVMTEEVAEVVLITIDVITVIDPETGLGIDLETDLVQKKINIKRGNINLIST